MSPTHLNTAASGSLVHETLTCGLGDKYCPGCTPELPEPKALPWGESLTRDYFQTLEQWEALDRQDRPGLAIDRREQLAASKLDTFDRAAVLRARAVNDLLTFLRWAREDAPGLLNDAVREAVREVVGPELDDLAGAVVRLERRLGRDGRVA